MVIHLPFIHKSIKQQIANLTICCLIFAEPWKIAIFTTDFQKLCRKKCRINVVKTIGIDKKSIHKSTNVIFGMLFLVLKLIRKMTFVDLRTFL